MNFLQLTDFLTWAVNVCCKLEMIKKAHKLIYISSDAMVSLKIFFMQKGKWKKKQKQKEIKKESVMQKLNFICCHSTKTHLLSKLSLPCFSIAKGANNSMQFLQFHIPNFRKNCNRCSSHYQIFGSVFEFNQFYIQYTFVHSIYNCARAQLIYICPKQRL